MLPDMDRSEAREFDAPLPHLVEALHETSTGSLEIERIAGFFDFKSDDILFRQSSYASDPENSLRPFEIMASGLLRLLGTKPRVQAWLRTPSPALDEHAPRELLEMGNTAALSDFVQDLLEGRPA